MRNLSQIFGFVFVLVNSIKDSHQLKDVHIKIPSAVIQGHDAVLECFFDLEGDQLYSLKWYRGRYEFYRYTPSTNPPIKQFKIKGLHVKEEESKNTVVVLKDVTRDISGLFSCEVTADQPSFFTDMQTADLQVVDLPKTDPYISGLKSRYSLGDSLKANCTSEDASPAANLMWYVNGMTVDGQFVRKHPPRFSADKRFQTAHSTLRLQITKKLFENGRLKVRCSASMHHLYHRSSEKSVELKRKGTRVKSGKEPPVLVVEEAVKEVVTRPAVGAPFHHWDERPIDMETYINFQSPINSLASTNSGQVVGGSAILLLLIFNLVLFTR